MARARAKIEDPAAKAMIAVHKPEDVAALATYLVSELADHINGCIFEVFHGHVGIFVEPPPVAKVIEKDGRWTAEELMKAVSEKLTAGRSREVFPNILPGLFKLPAKE